MQGSLGSGQAALETSPCAACQDSMPACAGGKPDASWPCVSSLITKLCIALNESAEQDCKPISFRS